MPKKPGNAIRFPWLTRDTGIPESERWGEGGLQKNGILLKQTLLIKT